MIEEIQREVDNKLIWRNFDGLKKSEIIYEIPGLDFDDNSNYDILMEKTLENVIKLKIFILNI